jgi:hypothetical protein
MDNTANSKVVFLFVLSQYIYHAGEAVFELCIFQLLSPILNILRGNIKFKISLSSKHDAVEVTYLGV